ncbi:hypothetical protein D9Q98_001754 [Chlorella vulgaris]|uniref:Uncharacterized protein n=1 Tax=Chlorella vulgaris TaxID=3077 RepID=A0A9D4TVD2_CHLVU|nr:hypothetical protein D9Q98_001754 [Chlorella vulgaris]
MKPALSFILVLLVAAQACSGARVLLGGAAASGQASGSTSASVTVGASVSGDNAIVGGEAKAEGKQTSTNLELSASNPTASSKLTTSGQAAGEDGTNLQSNGIVTLAPDTVTATGFTTGTAKGKDAVVAANTEAESKTKKYGTATAQSETFGTGSKKITGTAGVATISSPTGLQSESGSASESWKRSGLANSVARIVGPSPNSKTNANTFIFLTKDAVTGDATASGSGGNAQVQAALELLEKARVRWAWKP